MQEELLPWILCPYSVCSYLAFVPIHPVSIHRQVLGQQFDLASWALHLGFRLYSFGGNPDYTIEVASDTGRIICAGVSSVIVEG